MMKQQDLNVGGYSIIVQPHRWVMTGETAWSDCVHTIEGKELSTLRAVLGLTEDSDVAAGLERYSGDIHELFVTHASSSFGWWDPE